MRRSTGCSRHVLCLVCGAAWADEFTPARPGGRQRRLCEQPDRALPGRRHAAGPQAGGAGGRRRDPQAGLGRRGRRLGNAHRARRRHRRRNGWPSRRPRCAARRPTPTTRCKPPGRTSPSTDAGDGEVPSLLLMAEALKVLEPPGAGDPGAGSRGRTRARRQGDPQTLDATRRATGILVSRVATEPEAEPPRACIAFTVAPARRDDFHAEDWVRLDPPVQGAAVTREGDQICVSGLPSGTTTRIMLRAGMPGEGGLSLIKDTTLSCRHGQPARRASTSTRACSSCRAARPRRSASARSTCPASS